MMTTLQKRLLITISILTAIMVFISANLFFAFSINPNQLQVRYQTIEDQKVSKDMGIFSIVYFTDLQYGTFENDQRLEKLISAIEELDPSVLVFGGDLYDDQFTPDESSNQKLIQAFNSIEAPLGKFCVLGEKDINDENRSKAVRSIYAASGFEILENSSVRLTSQNHSSVRLTGLSTTPDYNILSTNSNEEYNIIVSHYPDNLMDESLASASISLALAGNAHGTQITYPLLGAYKKAEGATQLNRAKSEDLDFSVLLSAGVGCTDVDARLNADPEIHYLLFSGKD